MSKPLKRQMTFPSKAGGMSLLTDAFQKMADRLEGDPQCIRYWVEDPDAMSRHLRTFAELKVVMSSNDIFDGKKSRLTITKQ